MDSLFGILHRDGRPASPQVVEPMAQAMSGLGYCGNQKFRQGSVALGASVDHFQATSTVLVSDSRLDDRQTLCGRLGIAASDRRDISDAQLILASWLKWGEDCPRYLLGDYSFAIWEPRNRKMFCARDHIGARPLYYYSGNRVFVFANDLRGLMACPEVPRKLDEPWVSAYCRQVTFTHPSRTFYNGLLKLPPGHTITVELGRSPQLRTYWSPQDAPAVRLNSSDEYAEGLRERIVTAVRDRIAGEKRVGAHISGGLDCSSVAVLAARELQQRGDSLQAFAWSSHDAPDLSKSTSRPIIEEISRLECFPVFYRGGRDLLPWQRDASCDPCRDMACEWDVAQHAADRGVRLMLSGWGGDEAASFNGRGYYAEQFLNGRWLTLIQEMYARHHRTSKCRLKSVAALPRQFYSRVIIPLVGSTSPPRKELPVFFNKDFRAHLDGIDPLVEPGSRKSGVRVTMENLVQRGHLAHRMEHWAAHGAACGLEYAYPLADRRVLEFSLGTPCEQFVEGGHTRMLYRRAVEGILPASSQWSSKQDQAIDIDIDQWRVQICNKLIAVLTEKKVDPNWGRCIDAEKTMNKLQALTSQNCVWGTSDKKALKRILVGVSVETVYQNHADQSKVPIVA